MEITTIIALILFFIPIIIKWVLHNHHKNPIQTRPNPPQADGSWPIIGHLHRLRPNGPPHKVLSAMADRHGPMYTIKLGVKEALVVNSWELAKECLHVNDKAASGRPKSVAVELMCYNYAIFGFVPYGQYWRDVRKIVMLELLSHKRLHLLSHVWKSEATSCMKRVYELWHTQTNKVTAPNVVLLDLKKQFEDLTMSIMVRIISGKQFLSVDNEETQCFNKAIREFFHHLGSFTIGDGLPYLRWMDIGGQEKAMKETFIELDHVLQGWLDEHKEKRELAKRRGGDDDDYDFMDVMLNVLDDDDAVRGSNFDADTINKSTCLMMIAGGADSTTVTLTWAISLLLNHPHVLKTARAELDTQVGIDRQLTESDIARLPYLQAIVKETMRLYTSGPLMGPREFTKDCTIGGCRVQAGTRLIVNLYKIHRDPRVWENPTDFRPERFMTTHKELDVKGKHFELIPFGGGRRICPAIEFGLQVVHFALATFLHSFEISTPNNEPVDMSERFGLTNVKATPLDVLVAPRLPSNLYA